jgi:uncharacterized membrane protein
MFGRKNRIITLLAIVFSILFFLCGALVSLHRYWQFDSWYYDFGIFNQAIWSVSRFQIPIIDHFIVPGKIIFADHFSPSIFLLSPLFWITDRSEILLIAQAFFVALSGLILYFVGYEVLKDRLSSLLIMTSYFLFVGLQNAVITDFHEVVIMTPFLSALYFFYMTKRKRLFILFFLILLGFKESMFTLGLGLSFYIFFARKEWRRIVLFTFFFSIFWAIATTKFIIPFFSHQPYYYTPQTSITTVLADSKLKITTLLFSFGTFLFLPLGTLLLYPTYMIHFATRFFSDASTRWGLGLHYSAEIAPTFVFGSLLTLHKLKELFSIRFIRIVSFFVMLISLYIFRVALHGPFLLVFNPVFYQHTKDFNYLEEIIKKVPQDASVAAQNNLALRFYKQQSFILTESYTRNNPDYIVLDMRPGQNPNNFLGIKDEKKLFEKIKLDKNYIPYYQKGDQYIFKRKSI